MRGTTKENATSGVGAIRTQSRESRNPERGRLVEIGFLNADKVNVMGRKKVKQFSAPGSETASIPLESPEGVRGEKEQGLEGQPRSRGSNVGAEGEDTEWTERK